MPIVTREQWGARPPARPPYVDQLPYERLWLHHSTGPTGGAERARAIQADHLGRGWRDVAYQWLVGLDATYEGIRGRHLNEDRGHSGTICLIGNFETTPLPESIVAETAWLVAHGLLAGWWTTGITGGHRDLEATACPGRHAYAAIPAINARAAQIIQSLSEEDVDMTPDQDAKLDKVYQSLIAMFPGPQGVDGPPHNHGFAIQSANGGVVRIEAKLATLAGHVAQVRQLADSAATPAEVAEVVDAALGALVDALEGLPDADTGAPVDAETIRRLLIELLEAAA